MRCIIAGGRDFDDYELLCTFVNKIREHKEIDTIISGTARGADKLGERYAEFYGLDVEFYPADWNTHGKRAGYIRNQEMADNADILIAFWDGKSKGTKHMIDIATKMKMKFYICGYNQND